MEVPLEVTFRDVEKTRELEELIFEKVAKLDSVCEHLISCRVCVELLQKHHKNGNPYRVRIDMRFPPGHDVIVKRRSRKGDVHQPLPVLLNEAFDAAARKLDEEVNRQHGRVKVHPEQRASAIVSKVFPDEGYGFLRTIDTDREIYFHRNSVLHDEFDVIEPGAAVRFVAEQGEKGLQASTVEIVRPPATPSR